MSIHSSHVEINHLESMTDKISRLEQALREARVVLEFYADDSYHHLYETSSGTTELKTIFQADGGNRAREFLKSIDEALKP